jgi:hypothetical protein
MVQFPVSAGGMPQDAPRRPQIAPAFPAVDDMPPPRNSAVLTEEEKKKEWRPISRSCVRIWPGGRNLRNPIPTN